MLFRAGLSKGGVKGFARTSLCSVPMDKEEKVLLDYLSDELINDGNFQHSILSNVARAGHANEGLYASDQDIEGVVKLNEGDLDDDSNDTDVAIEEDELLNSDSGIELNTSELDSLCLLDKDEQLLPGNNTGEVKENQQNCEVRQSKGPENQDTCDQEENGENEDEDNPKLIERLARQRQRAIQAACRQRKTSASRNAYKDKGGRSSHSSKIQKQLNTFFHF